MQRGFIANFPASYTGVSCPAPHTIKTKADLNSLTAAILYRDIKKNGAGIVYNTGSSGYLNTENTAGTQISREVLPGLHLPKAHSTRTVLEDPNHESQFVTLKLPKNNYQLSPLYLWRIHDFTKVFISP